MKNSNETKGGFGFLTILFFIFLTLKLTGHIQWSWWWITAPLWIPLAIAIIGLIFFWKKLMR